MQKLKRILALLGAAFLLILYLATFILGLLGSANTKGLLMACIACTVIIPVLLYAMFLLARILGQRDERQHPGEPAPAEEQKEGAPQEQGQTSRSSAAADGHSGK